MSGAATYVLWRFGMRRHETVNTQHIDFNYNLEKMRAAVSAEVHMKPKNQTREEFLLWMKSKKTVVTV